MKILAYGDSLKLPTGYGRVNQNVLQYFVKKGHEVIQVGSGHSDTIEKLSVNSEEGSTNAFLTLIPRLTDDMLGSQFVLTLAHFLKPDIVYNSNDFFTSGPVLNCKDKLGFTYINYGIIAGLDCAKTYKDIIQLIDIPVIPSKYGYDQVKEYNSNAYYIPHGVDTGIYKPSNEPKENIKLRHGVAEKFVYGSVNRNIWRKQYPNLMRAFANLKYKHKLKDIVLYLIADPCETHNFFNWAKHLGLSISQNSKQVADIMLHPDFKNINHALTEEQLADTYNCFDVMVSASLAEGFGLSTIESQACGIPVIACDSTANTELIKGHGWLYSTLKNKDGTEVFCPPGHIDLTYGYAMPDYSMMELAMIDAYENTALREKYSSECIHFARQFDWPLILPQWDQVLSQVK